MCTSQNQLLSLISIDPGKTTGVVQAKWDGKSRSFELTESGEIFWDGRFAFVGHLINLVPDIVIIEDFRLYAHRAKSQVNNEFPSTKFISLVEYAVWMLGSNTKIVYQMASVIKSKTNPVQVPDEYKKQLPGAHMKDAFRHLRYYILTNRG